MLSFSCGRHGKGSRGRRGTRSRVRQCRIRTGRGPQFPHGPRQGAAFVARRSPGKMGRRNGGSSCGKLDAGWLARTLFQAWLPRDFRSLPRRGPLGRHHNCAARLFRRMEPDCGLRLARYRRPTAAPIASCGARERYRRGNSCHRGARLASVVCRLSPKLPGAVLEAAFSDGIRKVKAAAVLDGSELSILPVEEGSQLQNINTPEDWSAYASG